MGSAKCAVFPPVAATRTVVLVLHGGAERGSRPVRPWAPAYLRMVQLARAVHRAGGRSGIEVRLLRNRVRGWNEPDLDPVSDARWALERIRAARPDVPVILVGHSMGGRVALRVADDPQVAAVCALAPWTPKGEPVDPVAGRVVAIAHGASDRTTNPRHSHSYAKRAVEVAVKLARFDVGAEGHAMLRRPCLWTSLVRAFVLESAGLSVARDPLAAAWDAPLPARLQVRV